MVVESPRRYYGKIVMPRMPRRLSNSLAGVPYADNHSLTCPQTQWAHRVVVPRSGVMYHRNTGNHNAPHVARCCLMRMLLVDTRHQKGTIPSDQTKYKRKTTRIASWDSMGRFWDIGIDRDEDSIVIRYYSIMQARVLSIYKEGPSGQRAEDCPPSRCPETQAVVMSGRHLRSVMSGRYLRFAISGRRLRSVISGRPLF